MLLDQLTQAYWLVSCARRGTAKKDMATGDALLMLSDVVGNTAPGRRLHSLAYVLKEEIIIGKPSETVDNGDAA